MKEFFDHIERDYVGGKPPHIANPEASSFDIISFVDFQRMSTLQIQDRLRRKHIVVTGHPDSNVKFDAAGLRSLSPLHRKVSLQGTN